MKRVAETVAFCLVAILAHVALFARMTEPGHESGGSGGQALISLEAADATVAEMVEAWQRPPQRVEPAPELAPAPAPERPAVALPRLELAQSPRAEMRLPDRLPATRARPQPPAPVPDPPLPELPAADPPPPDQPLPDPPLPEPPAADPAPPPPSHTALAASPRPVKRPNPPPPEAPENARKAQDNSPGRAAQRAAGSGGGSQAGQAGRAATATASAGQEARAQAVWGAKIRARIERAKRYPRGTQAAGRVSLSITIARNGRLQGVRIARSSGNPILDQAALDAVRRAGRFPAAPPELTRQTYVFALAIVLKR